VRDLKPSNLLLDADDKIAVSDFGIAGLVDMTSSSTTTGQQGTPQYMAPEQFDQVGEAPLCHFFSRGSLLCLGKTTIILPRQAQDNQRMENAFKRSVFFFAQDLGKVMEPADVWAWACVMIEMLSAGVCENAVFHAASKEF
jgi:serine/threonine protein kinase